MLSVVPSQPPSPSLDEARVLLRSVEYLRPPPVSWWAVAEWALPVVLVSLVSFIACQVTDRLAPAAWLLVGLVGALLFIRPAVVRRMRG